MWRSDSALPQVPSLPGCWKKYRVDQRPTVSNRTPFSEAASWSRTYGVIRHAPAMTFASDWSGMGPEYAGTYPPRQQTDFISRGTCALPAASRSATASRSSVVPLRSSRAITCTENLRVRGHAERGCEEEIPRLNLMRMRSPVANSSNDFAISGADRSCGTIVLAPEASLLAR